MVSNPGLMARSMMGMDPYMRGMYMPGMAGMGMGMYGTGVGTGMGSGMVVRRRRNILFNWF